MQQEVFEEVTLIKLTSSCSSSCNEKHHSCLLYHLVVRYDDGFISFIWNLMSLALHVHYITRYTQFIICYTIQSLLHYKESRL
jgi:hypothetical protein